jgi:hypothetical protein
MRSTGEVMGIDKTFAKAYAKAAIAAGQKLPASGNVFITMIDKYKDDIVPIARQLTVRICCSCALLQKEEIERGKVKENEREACSRALPVRSLAAPAHNAPASR